MVRLFVGGLGKLRPQARIAGRQGLGVIQGLGRNFPGVINPHQTARMPPLEICQIGAVNTLGRISAPRTSGTTRQVISSFMTASKQAPVLVEE